MTFGGQTVTFVAVTQSAMPGQLGMKSVTRTNVDVIGCHFRPAAATEIDGQTDVATGIWKCTAPPVSAAIDARPNGELIHEGNTYRIDGPIMPKYDMAGDIHHVTIMCKRQES